MVSSPIWGVLPPRYGLFRLADHMEQRPIGATHGSIRSRIPLRTPSGGQNVESELEAELLEQLSFAPGIYDLLTQCVIRYANDGQRRRYTVDIVAYLNNLGCGAPVRYLIEVKRAKDLQDKAAVYERRFEIGRLYAEKLGAEFRIMTEAEIRTPYLKNTRLLRSQVGTDITDDELDRLWKVLEDGPLELHAVVAGLIGTGISEPDARDVVERSIVKRHASCDLSQPITERTMLAKPAEAFTLKHDSDPLLRMLRQARDR